MATLRENCPNTVLFGPYFPVFGLNTEIYEVNLHVKSDHIRSFFWSAFSCIRTE